MNSFRMANGGGGAPLSPICPLWASRRRGRFVFYNYQISFGLPSMLYLYAIYALPRSCSIHAETIRQSKKCCLISEEFGGNDYIADLNPPNNSNRNQKIYIHLTQELYGKTGATQ